MFSLLASVFINQFLLLLSFSGIKSNFNMIHINQELKGKNHLHFKSHTPIPKRNGFYLIILHYFLHDLLSVLLRTEINQICAFEYPYTERYKKTIIFTERQSRKTMG